MNTTLVAVAVLLIVGVGIYFGVSNLATQYGIEPSGGSATGVACAPQTAEARANQPIRFTASGLSPNTLYHWASDEGRSEVARDGSLEVRFTTPGQKTVYLFHAAEGRWYRTACRAEVR